MNILFTVCGRAGSKGIKNKNLKEFLKFPLPLYTVAAIDLFIQKNTDKQCDIVLNTDSEGLIDIFNKISLNFNVIVRDPSLSGDYVSKKAVISNCLEIMQQRQKTQYDMVVDLDITSPLRTVQDIENLVEKKFATEADVVFSVTDARRNPYFNMVKKTEYGFERVIASNFNARQEAPEIYDMNASLYAFSPQFLLNNKAIFEGKCDIIKMLDTAVLDLDHENDFTLMQVIARYLIDNYPDFRSIREHIPHLYK